MSGTIVFVAGAVFLAFAAVCLWRMQHDPSELSPRDGSRFEPFRCPVCRKPCVLTSNATSGGAVLGTSESWLCPDHGSWAK